jgi:hypothetical protein
MRNRILSIAALLLVCANNARTQQNSNTQKAEKKGSEEMCPMHNAHSEMNERGEKAMGFSQTSTTHHFVLKPDGGVIQVEANDSADTTARNQIRMHLTHIAQSFENGDFDIPMFVHDTVPPGVPEMKKLHKNINYWLEETANGGRVVITSSNKEAVVAIHKFLRFQIEEHKTGDAEDAASN